MCQSSERSQLVAEIRLDPTSQSVAVAYIDFAKAFDSVSRNKLCYQLRAYGVSDNLLNG